MPETAIASGANQLPIARLLLAAVLSAGVALVGLGGGLYYLVRSGRLTLPAAAPHTTAPVAPPPSYLLVLQPLLVNLADSGNDSYLRVAVTLRIGGNAKKQGAAAASDKDQQDSIANDDIASLRDTMLIVLGSETANDLLAANGKTQLKQLLKTALTHQNPEVKVLDIYFTEFLVQR